MRHVLTMRSGNAFLGGRSVAYNVRTQVELVLQSDADGVVILDFTGVDGVSHSFADELLSPLSDRFGDDVPRHVHLENCCSEVADDLSSVAEMHRLVMPSLGRILA